jgi:large subunit ribosomal protein L35
LTRHFARRLLGTPGDASAGAPHFWVPLAMPVPGSREGAPAITEWRLPRKSGHPSRSLTGSKHNLQTIEEEWAAMPKLKTHKGMKKRFKVSATGKVSHKRCGSSHLNSHKSGKRVRRLRKSTKLKVTAEARRIRFAVLEKQNVNPDAVHAKKLEAMAEHALEASGSGSPAATEKKTS